MVESSKLRHDRHEMQRIAIALVLAVCLTASPFAQARKHSSSHATSPQSQTKHASTRAAPGVNRDSHGRIARSQRAKTEFKKQHPCRATGKSSGACPGYVIDHVTALKRGGTDAPGNMQWQTKDAAKQKDKRE